MLLNNNKRKKKQQEDMILAAGVLGTIAGAFLLTYQLYKKYDKHQQSKKILTQLQMKNRHQNRETFLPSVGEGVGILTIPIIELVAPIVEGDGEMELAVAIGHHIGTKWPGDKQQIFMSGHRSGLFKRLKEVRAGDEIIIDMPYGSYSYHVIGFRIVDESESEVIETSTYYNRDQLVLMTCYPFTQFGGTKQRYLVYAERSRI